MELFLESSIDGDFTGWRENGKFSLANGDIWQQVSPEFKFCFKNNARTRIWKGKTRFLMEVQGMDGKIEVRRIFPEPL
jgi:hypothetical protein